MGLLVWLTFPCTVALLLLLPKPVPVSPCQATTVLYPAIETKVEDLEDKQRRLGLRANNFPLRSKEGLRITGKTGRID